MLPKRYSFLDWKPEPEDWSRERVSSSPLLSILARPSPHVMSNLSLKFAAVRAMWWMITRRRVDRNRVVRVVKSGEVVITVLLW